MPKRLCLASWLTILLAAVGHSRVIDNRIHGTRRNLTRLLRRDDPPSKECLDIAELITQGNEFGIRDTVVDAELAHTCLTSIPLDKDDAAETISFLQRMYQFHSSKAYLETPPPNGDRRPALDIMKGLEDIWNKVSTNELTSQYELELEIQSLFHMARDPHLVWEGVTRSSIFEFTRPVEAELVSLSDGKSPPQLYLLNDFRNVQSARTIPRPVTKIGDDVATTRIQLEANEWPIFDPHARYNMMLTKPTQQKNFKSGFRTPYRYPGAKTVIGYSTGPGIEFATKALAKANLGWEHVLNGESVYDNIVKKAFDSLASIRNVYSTGGGRSSTSSNGILGILGASDPSQTSSKRAVPQQPTDQLYKVLTASSQEDVMVLRPGSFNVADTQDPIALFAPPLAEFMKKVAARSTKPTKAILDLRGNLDDGYLDNAFVLLLALYAKASQNAPFGRFRAHDGINLLGTYDPSFALQIDIPYMTKETDWDYPLTHLIDPKANKKFASWTDIYKARKIGTDTFSALIGTSKYTIEQFAGIPSLEPKDLVIVTDGGCGDVCSLAIELLTHDPLIPGVKLITMGGEPRDGPSTMSGGNKGLYRLSGGVISSASLGTIQSVPEPIPGSPPGTNVPQVLEAALPLPLPIRSAEWSVNYLDLIRAGDKSETPIQFLPVKSHCRVYYTKDTAFSDRLFYDAVYSIAFGVKAANVGCTGTSCVVGWNSRYCVPGSFNPTGV